MSKYIRAEAAKGAIGRVCFGLVLDEETEKALKDAIDETQEEDVVKIVRCKDCKYNYLDPNNKKKCLKVDRISNPDFFCANGERKEYDKL